MELPERITSLEWWESISFEDKYFSTIKWLSHKNKDTTERHPNNLTGREIQEIHKLIKNTIK